MMDHFLASISYMLSRWANITLAIKNIATIPPSMILRDNTTHGRKRFAKNLIKIKHELLCDKWFFVMKVFPPSENCFTAVVVRYSFKVVFLSLRRLIKAVLSLPDTADLKVRDIDMYFSRLCIPDKNIYHGDLLHELFIVAEMLHLKGLSSEKSPINKNPTDNCDLIFYGHPDIERLLSYASYIESYPVIPENLVGHFLPTLQKHNLPLNIDIFEEGVDNRAHIKEISDYRACISCKMFNTCVGLTDVEEQLTKMKCKCIIDRDLCMAGSFYENAYMWRGLAIVRLLLMTKRYMFIKNIGCFCEDHEKVFREKINCINLALENAGVAI